MIVAIPGCFDQLFPSFCFHMTYSSPFAPCSDSLYVYDADVVGVGSGYAEHHHHVPPPADDVRPAQVFAGYNGSPSPYPGAMGHGSGIATARTNYGADSDVPADLFPDMPDAKKRKFILVEDNVRGSRLRIRVTLEGVNTKEIPDSFRKGSSVFPRSFFPREMQSPPPSATGGSFFENDDSDDGNEETEGREISRGRGRTLAGRGRGRTTVKVQMGEGREGELTVPRTRKSVRGKEVRLNELGCRMAWLQSRVFAGRTIFLQRASKYSLLRAMR